MKKLTTNDVKELKTEKTTQTRKKRKRLETTPRGKVTSAIRQLFLRSRERARALKDAQYTCAACGIKQSVARGREVKVQVHHREGIGNWQRVIDIIYEEILCSPDRLEVLCEACHHKITQEEKDGGIK